MIYDIWGQVCVFSYLFHLIVARNPSSLQRIYIIDVVAMAKAKRSVLITGCSDGGTGAALAEAFHNAGYKVYATARSVKKMEGLTASGIEKLELDILSESSITACVSKLNSLDVLVNNAGWSD